MKTYSATRFSLRRYGNLLAILPMLAALLTPVSASAETPADSSLDKSGVSAISPNFNPTNVDRGNEATSASPLATLPALQFPDNGILGDTDAVQAQLNNSATGTIRVIVTARPAAGVAVGQKVAQAAGLNEIAAAVAGTGSTVIRKGTVVPFMVVETTSAGLDAILAADATGAVELDRVAQTTLASATAVTGANVTHQQHLRGGSDSVANRWEVAILDTGTRTSHSAFGGRVTAEACFTTNASCPNGNNTQTGPGSGGSYGVSHGTHVAGIASGSTFSSVGGGIAREAGINAIRVFNNGGGAAFSSIASGIDFVAARELSGAKIAAINLSLGIYDLAFTSTCDSFSPATTAAINTARNQGILVLISAGNDGFRDAVSWPSCISGATSVANSTDQDLASSSTNIHPTLTSLWAPGTFITAASDTSNTASTNLSGTSMSAPHVAGAATALADCFDWDTPTDGSAANMDDQILARMIATGDSVTDNRSGGGTTLPRLNLLAAARNLNPNDAFASPETLPGTSGSDVDYSYCATEELGEPWSAGVASIWYEWTAPNDGEATFTTCDPQTTADSVINIYLGTALNNLVELVENDDDGNCAESTMHSTAVVQVTQGKTYKIRLSVFGGSTHKNGQFTLNYDFTPGGPVGLATVITADISKVERNSGAPILRVYFTLDRPAIPIGGTGFASMRVTTVDGTATLADNDYRHLTRRVQWGPGVTSRFVDFRIVGDRKFEPDETFDLQLSEPDGVDLGDGTIVVTIENDDPFVPTPTVDAVSQTVVETNGNQSVQVTFVLVEPVNAVTRVRYTTVEGSATRNVDYTHRTGFVTFPRNETTKTANIVIRGDAIMEPTESFTIALSQPTGLNLGDDATITITDNDTGVLPTVDAISQTVVETNGSQTVQVTFILDEPASATTRVRYTTVPGTATRNSDYTHRSGLVTFPAGQTTKTANVVVRGDTVMEPTESFTIALSQPTGLKLGNDATITITNDDEPPPTVNAVSQTIVETNGNQTIQVTFELDEAASATTRVRFTTVPGTATRNNDYTHRSVIITFQPDQTTKTTNVVIRGGAVPEPTESFTIALSQPTGLNLGNDATITIIDND